MKVLVCDDHAVFGESLALVLQQANIDVAGVTRSVDQALAVLRTAEVDVCVLDLVLGPTDDPGWDRADRATGAGDSATPATLRRLSELRVAAPRTRFVLLSGHLTRELVQTARAKGVSGFAHKGCHIREVVSTL